MFALYLRVLNKTNVLYTPLKDLLLKKNLF
jgi:hypothetical protein